MTREATVTSEMSKHERRRAAREARQAERARGIRSRRMRRWALRSATALVIAGLVGGLGWWVLRPKPGSYVPSQGNAHVTNELVGFRYASDPPTSGPHVESLASWGIHEEPVPKSFQVHNLEDGGVLVQYKCVGCGDLVSKLKDIVRRYPDKVILAPYPGMNTRIALTAWSYIDAFDQYDEQRILRFIEAHRGIDHHVRSSN